MQSGQNGGLRDSRLLTGCGSLIVLPLSLVALAFAVFAIPPVQNALEWCLRLFFEEVFVAAIAFFSFGLAWSVTGSLAIKARLDTLAIKFAWLMIPAYVIIAVIACPR